MFKYIDNPAAPLVVVNSYHCCIQTPPKPVISLELHCSVYIHTQHRTAACISYTQQCRNSTYMKFSPQATLKWAAQRMHSKVIRLVMHNANILSPYGSTIREEKNYISLSVMLYWLLASLSVSLIRRSQSSVLGAGIAYSKCLWQLASY